MTKIDPSKYVSPMAGFLTNPASYRNQKFQEAEKYTKEGMELHVGSNGVWWGKYPTDSGRSVQSYEKIGYHSGAEWLLEGYLAAGGKVFFHGFDGITGEVFI